MRNKILLLILPICLFIFGLNSAKAIIILDDKTMVVDVPSECSNKNKIIVVKDTKSYDDFHQNYEGAYRMICLEKTITELSTSSISIGREYPNYSIYELENKSIPSWNLIGSTPEYGFWVSGGNISSTYCSSDRFNLTGNYSCKDGSSSRGTYNMGQVLYSDINIKRNNVLIYDVNAKTPTIDIEFVRDIKQNDKVVRKVLNVKLSNVNKEKYNYFTKINNGYWRDVTTLEFKNNQSEFSTSENGTFYFKIEDKEGNYISSASFKTSGIEEYILDIEDVNYEYTNNKNEKITYNHLLKIPISHFYDFNSMNWKNYNFVFLSKSIDDLSSDILVTLHNKNNTGNVLPLLISLDENVQDFNDLYKNSDNVNQGGGNGSFGGGGGGIRDTSCDTTPLPYQKTIHNDNSNYYNILQLKVTQCLEIEDKTISEFKTDYVYVYYNARIYKDEHDLLNDYETNKENYESTNDETFFNSLKNSLNFFVVPIGEIFKKITYFFNKLPYQLRYTFIAIFVLTISLIIFKFII